jgi:hypothetical protein
MKPFMAVLFSALVLHWVTSKDSMAVSSVGPYTHTSGQILDSKANDLGSSNLKNKLASFGVYGRKENDRSEWARGKVTTIIQGGRDKDEETTDEELGTELGKIRVQVGRAVVIEHRHEETVEASVESSTTIVEGESGGDINRASFRSTEDLVHNDPIE